MNKYCILSIDQGTTGSKVYAFNEKAEVIASSYSEFTQIFPRNGWVEHDPMEIWHGVHKLLLEILWIKLNTLNYTAEEYSSYGYNKST